MCLIHTAPWLSQGDIYNRNQFNLIFILADSCNSSDFRSVTMDLLWWIRAILCYFFYFFFAIFVYFCHFMLFLAITSNKLHFCSVVAFPLSSALMFFLYHVSHRIASCNSVFSVSRALTRVIYTLHTKLSASRVYRMCSTLAISLSLLYIPSM